jgi:alcohol dehydrogenase class IV
VGADREGEYMAALDSMAENAFDDQCTGANPRYPLIADLRQILKVCAAACPPSKVALSSPGLG